MRTCIGCRHWSFDSGHGPWSDVTPGDAWSSRCLRGHWLVEGDDISEDQYRPFLLKAEDCVDYAMPDSPGVRLVVHPKPGPTSPPLPGVSEDDE